MPNKTLNFSIIFTIFIFLVFPKYFATIGAQSFDITNVGISVSVKDNNVQNGDIVCSGADGYKLCKNENDSSIYGIVNNNPSIGVQTPNLPNSQALISKGEVAVRVSSNNGNIKAGNFLTTSKIPGVAELSVKQGYVIGTALEDYASADKNTIGTVRVAVNIHPNNVVASSTRQNLIELIRSGISGLGVDPISALRYILAALVVISSLITGFVYFGRIAITGVEAIGRNPLAGGRIEFSVIINITIMLLITGAGLGIAYLILAL